MLQNKCGIILKNNKAILKPPQKEPSSWRQSLVFNHCWTKWKCLSCWEAWQWNPLPNISFLLVWRHTSSPPKRRSSDVIDNARGFVGSQSTARFTERVTQDLESNSHRSPWLSSASVQTNGETLLGRGRWARMNHCEYSRSTGASATPRLTRAHREVVKAAGGISEWLTGFVERSPLWNYEPCRGLLLLSSIFACEAELHNASWCAGCPQLVWLVAYTVNLQRQQWAWWKVFACGQTYWIYSNKIPRVAADPPA